ncbi:hypothetical protein C8R44DRAFT_744652 [Mycena epipterygia]|nr:hypothetical protein C8R44DRAFT_744652 [Mycena epipterygia]
MRFCSQRSGGKVRFGNRSEPEPNLKRTCVRRSGSVQFGESRRVQTPNLKIGELPEMAKVSQVQGSGVSPTKRRVQVQERGVHTISSGPPECKQDPLRRTLDRQGNYGQPSCRNQVAAATHPGFEDLRAEEHAQDHRGYTRIARRKSREEWDEPETSHRMAYLHSIRLLDVGIISILSRGPKLKLKNEACTPIIIAYAVNAAVNTSDRAGARDNGGGVQSNAELHVFVEIGHQCGNARRTGRA